MAITVARLAEAVRVDGTDPAYVSILTRLCGVGKALVAQYAPDAPTAIRDEAIIRVAAYLLDQPEASPGARYATAWRNSGAEALAGPWVNRAGVIAGEDDA